jgi:hypothetical protein
VHTLTDSLHINRRYLMTARTQALPFAMLLSMAAMMVPTTAWTQPASGGMEPGMMGPGMMGPGMGRGMGMPSFSTFDLDGDGTLTEDEFNKAHSQRMQQRAQQGYPMRNAAYAPGFETFDRDGNGRVNASEFAAAQAEHRQRMMGQP